MHVVCKSSLKKGEDNVVLLFNVEKVYENGLHGPLFTCLSDFELPQVQIFTIEWFYMDNIVSVQLGTFTTGPIRVKNCLDKAGRCRFRLPIVAIDKWFMTSRLVSAPVSPDSQGTRLFMKIFDYKLTARLN